MDLLYNPIMHLYPVVEFSRQPEKASVIIQFMCKLDGRFSIFSFTVIVSKNIAIITIIAKATQ